MPLNTAKPLMAEAEALLAASRLAETDELIGLCAEGLGFLCREASAYCGTTRYCKRFVPHFSEQLAALVHTLQSSGEPSSQNFSHFGEVQQNSFALLEDIALFMREKTLRNGEKANETEERILSYFETCGNWLAPSGEMVTDTYYNLLPIAVMRDLQTAG
ncbi:MAG: hypothetical protein DELT_02057 [Desulfovibrio sp.]